MKILGMVCLVALVAAGAETPKKPRWITHILSSNMSYKVLVPAADGKAMVIACSVKIDQAATVNSTMPTCTVVYTNRKGLLLEQSVPGPDDREACHMTMINTYRNICAGEVLILPKAGTPVMYYAHGYTSAGSTTMRYILSIAVTLRGL